MILMLKLMLEYLIRKWKIIGAVCKLFQPVDAVAYMVDIIFRFSDADNNNREQMLFSSKCTCYEAMTGLQNIVG